MKKSEADASVKGVVLTGKGNTFIAGADIKAFSEMFAKTGLFTIVFQNLMILFILFLFELTEAEVAKYNHAMNMAFDQIESE
jgi:enoyl-CoA hydratase/carnithine racemase